MSTTVEPVVTVGDVDEEGMWSVFDTVARRRLGVSGEEFIEKFDAGEYDSLDDTSVMRVAMKASAWPVRLHRKPSRRSAIRSLKHSAALDPYSSAPLVPNWAPPRS